MVPTIGRKVWFFGTPHDSIGMSAYTQEAMATAKTAIRLYRPGEYAQQPMDATVVYVHDERTLNLLVLDHEGNAFRMQGVSRCDGATMNAYGWDWMPYQKGQAAKTEAAEAEAREAR